jgi:choline dehydrogenase-like flavoprotein
MPGDADILVIGSGAGGGTFAYACARAGKRVLLLERGLRKYPAAEPAREEQAMLIDKKPYDDRPVLVNGSAKRLYMGSVLGGGTSLYGAVLMRPSADDFHPGKAYGHRLPRPAWDWPVTYRQLEPYYDEAEALYGVAGWGEDEFGPLEKPRHSYPRSGIPLKPINQRLMSANRARGLKPFRLPLAIDFTRCLQCGDCPGYICPNGARRSSAHLAERADADKLPLNVLTGVEAERLTRDGRGQIDGVQVLDRTTGRHTILRATRYALACGAIRSPALLLRSGFTGPLVGRHYMLHLCPVVIGVFRGPTGADQTYVKQVGFADYYFGTRRYAHKMGLIQSLPVPGPLMVSKATRGRLPRAVVQLLRRRMLPLTGIVEDLPNPANRVCLGGDGAAVLRHRFGPYDHDRGRQLGRLMRKILRNAGALFCLAKSLPSDELVAHQCGTLRFGTDPAQAVLDPDCRVFGRPNLFVVDASFFPTSLGVGPALTIMANALRVADVVTREV